MGFRDQYSDSADDDWVRAADRCVATVEQLRAFGRAHSLDAWQCAALANVGALR